MEKRAKRSARKIKVGDLVYSKFRKAFGIISYLFDDEADTWVVYWTSGIEDWHHGEDLRRWKKELNNICRKAKKETVKKCRLLHFGYYLSAAI